MLVTETPQQTTEAPQSTVTTEAPKPLWYPSNNLIAQLGHFGWGAWLISLFNDFVPLAHALLIGIASVVVYAFVKEFIIDKFIEKQNFSNNALDFSMYMAGLLVETGLIVLKAYLKAHKGIIL